MEYTISQYICKVPLNTRLSIYATTGVLRVPVVVYIETVVLRGTLHIHREMVYTSHFLIFLGPNPVVVYI